MSSKLKWYGDRAEREVKGQVATLVRAAAAVIVQYCRAECPVLTGRLRRSIREEEVAGSDGLAWRVVAGGDDAPYAEYVIRGTRHQRPNDFMSRGISRSLAAVRRILGG